MVQERVGFTEAQFEPIFNSVGDFWKMICVLMLIGSFIAYANLPSFLPEEFSQLKKLAEGFIAVFGRFVQILVASLFVCNLIIWVRHGFFAKGGNFKGECPYCGTATRISVPSQVKRHYCSNCKNRFVLKSGKFYQLEQPIPLDARFSCLYNVNLLLYAGAVIPSVAFVFMGIPLTQFQLIATLQVIIFWAVLFLALQIWGLWLFCLQGYDRIYGRSKRWIIVALCLQHITLALLINKLAVGNDWRIDFLLKIISPVGQFASLTFLINLCNSNFLQRPDLGTDFDEILINTLIIFVVLLVQPLLPASYELLLLTFFVLLGLDTLFGY